LELEAQKKLDSEPKNERPTMEEITNQLRDFKMLLEEELISQSDYEKKKKELLGI